jgi:hypothetical protein
MEREVLDEQVIAWVLAAVEHALRGGRWQNVPLASLVNIGKNAKEWADSLSETTAWA